MNKEQLENVLRALIVITALVEAICGKKFVKRIAKRFRVLSDEAIFTYKVDNVYAPQYEAGIRWNDPELNLLWPIDQQDVVTSEKDLNAPLLRTAELFE